METPGRSHEWGIPQLLLLKDGLEDTARENRGRGTGCTGIPMRRMRGCLGLGYQSGFLSHLISGGGGVGL